MLTLCLLSVSDCTPPEVCVPRESHLGFFSKGDCILTDAEYFQGHEWITFFANEDLKEEVRFSKDELQAIAEGNRRTDWPKEMLVHMNSGPLIYVQRLTKYTNEPENQRMHFLLSDKNTSQEAAADSLEKIRALTRESGETWLKNPERALTLAGQATHIIQDSFSTAHTVRDFDDGWCIQSVKAYLRRADGFATSDIEYHGRPDGGEVGHATVEDSIYLESNACQKPEGRDNIEDCFNETATRARLGTMEYLTLLDEVFKNKADESDTSEEELDIALEGFFKDHFSFCE